MSVETLVVKLVGQSALIMHSDRFSNPLDPAAKRHKVLTAKRNKTDDDHEAIAFSEWEGGLYYDQKMGPYLPTANIRSTLVEGAKLRKLGKAVQRGVQVYNERVPLEYLGPREMEGLRARFEEFSDARSVVISGKRIMRYRPIFRNWSASIELFFDSAVIDKVQILQSLHDAGKLIGIGDFRPNKGGSFGRFTVEEL